VGSTLVGCPLVHDHLLVMRGAEPSERSTRLLTYPKRRFTLRMTSARPAHASVAALVYPFAVVDFTTPAVTLG
jgi:hypothetical protein